MSTVVVTDHPFPDMAVARAVLEPAGHTLSVHRCGTPEEVLAAATGAAGILTTFAPLPASVIERLDECRAIARMGIGLDNIAVDVATRRGIVVTNVPDYCIDEVATHTIALLLAAHRRIATGNRLVRDGTWGIGQIGLVRRLTGQTLGLVGAGRIPRAVATRAAALGLRVTAYDPYVADDAWPRGMERRPTLLELARDADILSVHAPLTPETRHLVDAEVLSTLPRHAILVNTARGALVDEAALARALREGTIAGAAVDVLEVEPPGAETELLDVEEAIVTPHVAFYSEEALADLQRKGAENLRMALDGQRPPYLVNPAVLELPVTLDRHDDPMTTDADPTPTFPDLAGKVVVVTGGSRGIGAATCRAFGANRAAVAVCGRDRAAIDETVETVRAAGGTAVGLTGDAGSSEDVAAIRRRVEAELGPTDIVAPFAGGFGSRTPLLEITLAEWESVVHENLTSTFLALREFGPGMVERARGAFVTMASNSGRYLDIPLTASYASSKAAVIQLTRHAAKELGPHGVRVNCVAPATTLTERVAGVFDDAARDRVAKLAPLGRLGQPEDTAWAALYLASESARWITGVTLDVAGGRIML